MGTVVAALDIFAFGESSPSALKLNDVGVLHCKPATTNTLD